MATVRRFEDLQVWQKARIFSNMVFQLTKDWNSDPDHRRQFRRSADSVMDNIAEGFGRGTRKEFVQFLSIAKGSLEEAKSQLYRAKDRGYITGDRFDSVFSSAEEISAMIRKLMQYLNRTTIAGSRYKTGDEPGNWQEEPTLYTALQAFNTKL